MDVREKLVELVHNARMNALWHNAQKPDEYITDMLMADGVTVQGWISVKDRLPDLELVEAKADDFDLYACLATIKNKRARNGRYVGKAWYDGERFMNCDCVDITYDVTHWQPLPEPPKEE